MVSLPLVAVLHSYKFLGMGRMCTAVEGQLCGIRSETAVHWCTQRSGGNCSTSLWLPLSSADVLALD